MAFSPDGTELYVGQTMREWAGPMEGLQRIQFNGGRVFEVLKMHLTKEGFELEFTEPVDAGTGEKPESFETETYGYQYSSNYGGPETHPRRTRPSRLEWSTDRRRVQLAYSEMEAQRVMRVTLSGLKSGGEPLAHTMVAYTLNKLAK
jgi:hypothetical protein